MGYKGLYKVTRCYRGLKGLHSVLACYRLLKGVTKFYKGVERGLQGFTRFTGGCKGLHWDRGV